MKQKHLLSSLFVLTALLSGCSNSDDVLSESSPGSVKTYTATVMASKGGIDGIEAAGEEGTRALFYGGNNTKRYATVWDKDDVVQVYKDGLYAGSFSLNVSPNSQYQGTKEAVLSGTLSGDFKVGDDVELFLTSKEAQDLSRTYTGQDGTINRMSGGYCYQKKTVKVSAVSGTTITLEKANMSHRQAYVLFHLTDEAGNRLHPKQLTISASPVEGYPGRIVTSVAADGTESYGDLVINTVKEDGEYPGELFVAILNESNNTMNVNYHLRVVTEDGEVYEGPSATQVNTTDDRPFKGIPSTGGLASVWRKLRKLASPTSTTATLGDMEGQQSFGELSGSATLGSMSGTENISE